MKELRKESLQSSIIKAIAEYISENHLEPGDKLPTEIEISKKLNVARSSVREGLKTLQAIGILDSKPGLGTIVSSKGLDPFVMSLIIGTIMGKTTLQHLGEIRIIMEQGAVPLIIARASKEELDQLMVKAKELDNQKEEFALQPEKTDNKAIAEREIDFHQQLLSLSQNPVLEKFGTLFRMFFYRVSSTGELFIQTQSTSIPSNERVMHVQIVEALQEKNIAKAEEAVRLHLRYWAECKDEIDPAFIYKVILPSFDHSRNT